MNKRGFTLIELITTFALSTIIIILLINVVILIKNIYTENDIKTGLLIEQSNLSNLINKKFSSELISYIPCDESDFCFSFDFSDGTTSVLVVDNQYIRFDGYVYDVKDSSIIGVPSIDIIDVEVSNVDSNNSFLVIKVPISNKLYPKEDFGINVVYSYNSNKITL